MKPKLSAHFIGTTQAVFCVAFSPDGKHLAAGTGSYYAAGSQLLLFPLSSESVHVVAEPQSLTLNRLTPHPKNPELMRPEGLSATALGFTADSQHLWLATSASYRRPGPIFCIDLFAKPLKLPTPRPIGLLRDAYPDGFVQVGQQLLVSCHDMAGNASGRVYQHAVTATTLQPSSSPKLVALNGQVVTPSTPRTTSALSVMPDNTAPKFGLSFVPVAATPEPNESKIVPIAAHAQSAALGEPSEFTPLEPSITIATEHLVLCLASQPGSQGFTSGNSQGQLHQWWFDGTWRHRHIAPVDWPKPETVLAIEDSTFSQNSILAIQYLPNLQGWLSLQANGLLIHWQGDDIMHFEQVSHVGTPRCMALHPTQPLLAIGVKHNANREGAGIILVDLSIWVHAIKL